VKKPKLVYTAVYTEFKDGNIVNTFVNVFKRLAHARGYLIGRFEDLMNDVAFDEGMRDTKSDTFNAKYTDGRAFKGMITFGEIL
jgi:hypothetical protein